MSELDAELLALFTSEAIEQLDSTEELLLQLGERAATEQDLNQIFRTAHNLKGSGMAIGLTDMAKFVHKLEDLISALKRMPEKFTQKTTRILFTSVDCLRRYLQRIQSEGDTIFHMPQAIYNEIVEAIEGLLWKDVFAELSGATELPPGAEPVIHPVDPNEIKAGPKITVTEKVLDELPIGQAEAVPSFDQIVSLPLGAQAMKSLPQAELAADPSTVPAAIPTTIPVPTLEEENGEPQPASRALLATGETQPVSPSVPEFGPPSVQPVPQAPSPISEPQLSPVLVPVPKPTPTNDTMSPSPITARPTSTARAMEETLKVEVKKLNRLLDIAGELVIHQNMLNQRARALVSFPQFDPIRDLVVRMSRMIQLSRELSFNLRMVSLRSTFQKLKRTVADLAHQQNKAVELDVVGEHIELDKKVIESITDPLTHLVRNAVDHGIESPEDRMKAGKHPKARLKFSAVQRVDSVVIEVSDDGLGLQKAKILSKAIAKGLIRPDQELTDPQICDLIFEPGFSTKEVISDISGRGVGMDIVKKAVTDLGGKIRITTVEGKGTTFQVQLPLSVSIVDGMVCEARKQRFIVPLSSIRETVQIEKSRVGVLGGKRHTFPLRGEELPLFTLGGVMHGQYHFDCEQEITYGIISHFEQQAFVMQVDRLIGVQQIVIKPVGAELAGIPGLSGSAVLGDGRAGIILDLAQLIAHGVEQGAIAS